MKKTIIIGVIVAVIGAISVVFQNCAENQYAFSTIQNSAAVSRQEVDLGGGLIQVTDQYVVRQEKQTMVDMVWVVDNSGSMSTEAEHVRKNVLGFATAVESLSNFKLALISKIGTTGYGTYLPETLKAKGGVEVDFTVGSTNALMVLGAALCKKMDALFPCAELVDGSATTTSTSYATTYGSVHGALDNFYRIGSKKIFVAVTDDETTVAGSDFLQFFNNQFPNERPRFFGFIGLGASSPCQARQGQQYQWLADETAGATYNICSADWAEHFKDLTSTVGAIANYEYELKTANIITVISVKINGTALDAASYKIQNGVLSLLPSVAVAFAGGTLEIVYTYQM